MPSLAADLSRFPADADFRYEALLAPPVLLFADDGVRRARLSRLIVESGGRLTEEGDIRVAVDRLDRRAGARGIVLDLRADDGASLDALLGRLGDGRTRAVLILTPALIDPVIAGIGNAEVTILVDPDQAEIADALADLVARPDDRVSDNSVESRRLAQLREEVGRIARRLASLSRGGDAEDAAPRAEAVEAARVEADAGPVPASDIAIVRALIRLRRARGQYFEPALFADPAWDMLLDLISADLERQRVAVSSLCIAAMVPPTTALRWIAAMTEQGLFARHADPADGRRIFIALTDAARAAMERYLAAARGVLAG